MSLIIIATVISFIVHGLMYDMRESIGIMLIVILMITINCL